MSYENIGCEQGGGIAVVTVRRPAKLNALNAQTIAELSAAFSELAGDDTVGAVVLTGEGEKAFVAGADIGELANLTAAEAERLSARGQALMDLVENLGKPVVAAINGFALGGGCELALACSFRFAAQGARLGLPETGLGLIPGYGGTQRLPRLVGRGRALELILTGDMVDADAACAMGLVNRVLPPEDLLTEAKAVAAKLAVKSPLTLRAALKAVNEGLAQNLDGGCRLESALFGVCGSSEDAREGCTAFMEKRAPEFKGR